MPYLYYNIIFIVSYYVDNTNGIPTPNSYFFKLLSILSKKYSQQVKAKQTQSNRGGNRQPPPVPFETPIGSNDSDRKFLQHPFRDRGMPLPSRKKTRRGKRKKRTRHTGRRHTPNAPDPILDCGGVPWCISDDTTDKYIKFTDFDDTSTDPVCMPLVYWSTQTTATINLLRPKQSTNTVYLPYVSPANAAATIIKRAYSTYINATDTDLIIARLRKQIKKELNNSIVQNNELLNNNIGTVTGNIVGDNRLLDDNW
jgi:hypothetical protein